MRRSIGGSANNLLPQPPKSTADGSTMHMTVTWGQGGAFADQGPPLSQASWSIRGEMCDTAHTTPSYS